jgi:hypothetical protein
MTTRIFTLTAIFVFCVSLAQLTGARPACAQALANRDPASERSASGSETPEAVEAIFTNPTPISVTAGGSNNGAPYPSSINVTSLTGLIPFTPGSVRVTLNNFSHTRPSDLGLVLVSPTGAAYLIQDGAGGAPGVSNVTYTLSDTGAGVLPQPGSWSAGTYKPTAYFTFDLFPAPGPATSYARPGPFGDIPATFSTAFGGTNPNGTWNLYVRDFLPGEGGSIAGGWTLEITGGSTQHRAVMDFDGDNRTDDATLRIAGSAVSWYALGSTDGFTGVTWGISTDEFIPADYDGDGKTDVAVFRSGVFYILRSSNSSLQVVNFGQVGDKPYITQDFDNDGRADPAVTRNEGANISFYVLRSSLGFTSAAFGSPITDAPIRGDFDGDGKADVAVYRKAPANAFYIVPSGGGPLRSVNFGVSTSDLIVPADFDGDGRTDIAVYRGVGAGSNGTWYWLRSSDGAFAATAFGIGNTDLPVPGDYDGDGRTDQAVFRRNAPVASFYHLGSVFTATSFGNPGDFPVGFTQAQLPQL